MKYLARLYAHVSIFLATVDEFDFKRIMLCANSNELNLPKLDISAVQNLLPSVEPRFSQYAGFWFTNRSRGPLSDIRGQARAKHKAREACGPKLLVQETTGRDVSQALEHPPKARDTKPARFAVSGAGYYSWKREEVSYAWWRESSTKP